MASPSIRHDHAERSRPAESNDQRDGRLSSESSLNILRVATDLYADVTGGGAIHAHAMSKKQAEWGHDVTVLTSDHGERSRPDVTTSDGYTIVRHREIARPFENSITPGVLASLRKRLPETDVVHAHSHLYFTTNIAAAVNRISDTPLVVTNHGLMSQTAPKWVQRLFIPTVARFTFNSADRILCYTETDRQRLRERKVHAPIDIVKNGIDCQQFTPTDDHPRQQILFVGRLTDTKGVPLLLDVFDRLTERHPALELRIVGGGPKRSQYEAKCVELGIADRVTFAGDVPYDAMPREYRDSLALVLPSQNEGLPRTVLEAMACETPVVTTALSQLEPVVSGAGYTADGNTPTEFVDAISRLVDDAETRQELGEAGRRQVLANNSWTQTVERTTDLFYELRS